MAHYFKFHSLDDIRAEVERLGLSIKFQDDLGPLFRPIRVGDFPVGNSLCVHPMEGCDGTLDGRPDELTFRRYQRFGAGGAKVIWGEAAAVRNEARATSRQLLVAEHTIGDLERMLNICRQAHRESFGHDDDLLVGLQLTHSGRYSWPRPILATHDPLLDGRTIMDKSTGRTAEREEIVSDEYLAGLVESYVEAAKLIHKAGYQFVDVKQCHRYFLNELLSATNRPGPYGGSYENRTRLPRDIIRAIRSEVPGLAIFVRLNLFDSIAYRKKAGTTDPEPDPHAFPLSTCWGTDPGDHMKADLTEPIRWMREMQDLGVACVNASMGNPYANPHFLRPFEYPPPDAYETPEHPLIGVDRHFRLTAEAQRACPNLPVIGSGYSYLQEFLPQAGAANLSDNAVSLVGVGRATLAQPDFVKQLMDHGQLDRKRICRTFSYCTALMRSKHNELGQFATGCPPFDKDPYAELWNAAKKK